MNKNKASQWKLFIRLDGKVIYIRNTCLHLLGIVPFQRLRAASSTSTSWWVSPCHNIGHFTEEQHKIQNCFDNTCKPPLRAPNTILPNKEKSVLICCKKSPLQKSGYPSVCSECSVHSYVITEVQHKSQVQTSTRRVGVRAGGVWALGCYLSETCDRYSPHIYKLHPRQVRGPLSRLDQIWGGRQTKP